MLVGIGTDIIEIERVKQAAQRPGFIHRVYTEQEQNYCGVRKDPYACYAGRFAAKEAVIKCLGRGMPWRDIEIVADERGKPLVRLTGEALKQAGAMGISRVLVSISHNRGQAVAFAVAVNRGENGCDW